MRTANSLPLVLEGITTSSFLQYVMQQHAAPTHLIICSTRDDFLREMITEMNPPSSPAPEDQGTVDSEQTGNNQGQTVEQEQLKTSTMLLQPTLRFLATSQTVKVSFCPDLTHLLALLASLPYRHINHDDSASPHVARGQQQSGGNDGFDRHIKRRPILAILNPIRLHKPTSSYSAQGFNRTFASAVETAYLLGQQLVLVEAPEQPSTNVANDYDDEEEDRPMYDSDHEHKSRDRASQPHEHVSSPWDEQLSMLNVTTKTFGVGDRGWAGRTVSIRQVAQRWCTFVRLEETSVVEVR
ncbi:hypothetical protein AAFC00_003010 [Neodothiora populina]|uniref:Uncharacterized protein n=1 Tax=Neodothiora populina TaxID=2781224 RepID=A0ABR3P994_9PEZI